MNRFHPSRLDWGSWSLGHSPGVLVVPKHERSGIGTGVGKRCSAYVATKVIS